MAGNLHHTIERLSAKTELLAERYRLLLASRSEQAAQIEHLQQQVEALRRTVAEREREIEYLKVASVLTPDHRDVEQTRKFLSDLVREIDKCIDQLSI